MYQSSLESEEPEESCLWSHRLFFGGGGDLGLDFHWGCGLDRFQCPPEDDAMFPMVLYW